MHKTDDLISRLGAKSKTEGAADAATRQQAEGSSAAAAANTKTGDSKGTEASSVAGKESSTAATGKTDVKGSESNSTAGKDESASGVADPNSWTIESAFKEIKKLREENKATRIKYEESVEKLKAEAEARISTREQELANLVESKKQLDELKAKEEDKKRDLSEKLAHRESLIAEQRARMEMLEKDYKSKLEKASLQLQKYEAEVEAQNQVYKQRLDAEVESIPAKFKEYANLIVKGAGDPREALLALHQAKINGIFDDKTVVVNHSVPGAKDGARATKEKLEEGEKAARASMSSNQKIGAALKNIFKDGVDNPAFRTHKK